MQQKGKNYCNIRFIMVSRWMCLKAQISPPGLGDANNCFWGLLEFAASWILLEKQALSYVAIKERVVLTNENLFSKQAIL